MGIFRAEFATLRRLGSSWPVVPITRIFPACSHFLSNRCRGVCMSKINYRLALRDRGVQIVPDINLGGNFQLRIGRRARNEGLTHTPFGAVDEQFERGHRSVRSLGSIRQAARSRVSHRSFNAQRVERNFSLLESLISQSGRRTSALMTPLRKSAYLIGTGFGSMNKSLNSR